MNGVNYIKSVSGNNWRLVFNDEFDGEHLSPLRWNIVDYRIKPEGMHSNIDSAYINTPENVYCSDGMLHIIATKAPSPIKVNTKKEPYNVLSGYVTTKNLFSFMRGRIEAKVRIDQHDSFWPAFWLLPQDDAYGEWPRSGEIDIFEHKGYRTNYCLSGIHWGHTWNNKGGSAFPLIDDSFDYREWHVYALEWFESYVAFYIDDRALFKTSTIRDEPLNPAAPNGPYDKPFYIIFNLAVGGDFLNEPYRLARTDNLNKGMHVDYVRVYELSDKHDNIEPIPSDDKERAPEQRTPLITNWMQYNIRNPRVMHTLRSFNR